jgi:hypothetical protein
MGQAADPHRLRPPYFKGWRTKGLQRGIDLDAEDTGRSRKETIELVYVAAGMVFLLLSSDFALYGRPAMLLSAYASPIPGSAASCSIVAELMSTNSALALADAKFILSKGTIGVDIGSEGLACFPPKIGYRLRRFHIAPSGYKLPFPRCGRMNFHR